MPENQTYLAAYIPEKGAKAVVKERSTPSLEHGEVLIRVTTTAINPVDWKLRELGLTIKEWPAILGSDAAGEIAEVGAGVEGFSEGDRVFWQGRLGYYDYSTFQQYTKMPAELVARTPKNISDDQAGGIYLATIAALTAIYDGAGRELRPMLWEEGGDKAGEGKAIVILGGSSSVGQYAIQLARLAGFSRIITNSSASHIDHLKDLGATTVLDRGSKPSAEDFAQEIGDLPLDMVFDTISEAETQLQGVEILQAAKKVTTSVVVHLHPGQDGPEALEQAKKEPKVQIKSVFGAGAAPHLRYISEPSTKYLGGEDGVIARGLYQPNRSEVVPGGLNGLEDAMEKNKKGVSGVKIVIRPHET